MSAMTTGLDRGVYPAPVEHGAVRADFAAEGFTFGVFQDPPGQEWNGFLHDEDEYVVVAEGRLAIEIAGERFEAGPGDRARIPAGALHSLKTLTRAGSVWLYGYRFAGGGDG